jgi:regulatory protein
VKQPRSLKARALQLLAQREQSRTELRRKLLRHARAELAEEAASGDSDAAEAYEGSSLPSYTAASVPASATTVTRGGATAPGKRP